MAALSPSTLNNHPLGLGNPGPIVSGNWEILNAIFNTATGSSDPLYQLILRALLKNSNVDASLWTAPIRGFSAAVNLKTVAATNILTNNFGKDFILDAIDILPITVTAITVQPTLRITKSTGGVDDFVASVTLPAISATQNHRLTLKAFPLTRLETGSSIKVDVTTGATGTTYSAKFGVLGTIVP